MCFALEESAGGGGRGAFIAVAVALAPAVGEFVSEICTRNTNFVQHVVCLEARL